MELGLESKFERPPFEYFIYNLEDLIIYPFEDEKEMIEYYEKNNMIEDCCCMYLIKRLKDGSYKTFRYDNDEIFLHMYFISNSAELAKGFEYYADKHKIDVIIKNLENKIKFYTELRKHCKNLYQ